MSKILVVGDVHNKPEIFKKALQIADKESCDKVLLMGDYLDDFGDTPETTFNTIMALRETLEDPRVIALIGNHELSYLEDQRCSGWTAAKKFLVDEYVERSKLTLSYQESNWLFTHAGLTERWWKYANRLNITPGNKQDPTYIQQEAGETYSSWLNRYWERYPGIYKSVGKERGGFGIGSPLWADWHELIHHNMPGINQVVGHTSGNVIEEKEHNGDRLICVDIWSNDGPGGFLLWEDGKTTMLDSTGSSVVQAASGA